MSSANDSKLEQYPGQEQLLVSIPGKDFSANRHDMSVTALVSQVEIWPKRSIATVEFLHHAATALRSVGVVNLTNVVGESDGAGLALGAGLVVGSVLGGAVTVKEVDGEQGQLAPSPRATIAPSGAAISQLTSSRSQSTSTP